MIKIKDNLDINTVDSFGNEWLNYDQTQISKSELKKIFDEYFFNFPWNLISINSVGFDMGCGSGRWAQFVAAKVACLHCIDPSLAIDVAKSNLSNFDNIIFHKSDVANNSLKPNSMDFGYSLGVLHHVPDTIEGLISCSKLLKKGAPFLVYLYYNLDNRNYVFKFIWILSNFLRFFISKLPNKLKNIFTDLIAFFIYFPLSKFANFLEFLSFNIENFPLSYYRNHSFYTMRTDARDRFGTPLEKRFSKKDIYNMLVEAGFDNIIFSTHAPYWCAVAIKK